MKKNFEHNLPVRANQQLFNIRKFPKQYRDDVFKLYSFMYVTGSFLENNQPDLENFKYILRRWQHVKRKNAFSHFDRSDDSINEHALANITYLVHRYGISTKEIDDYLRSVAIVLRNKPFHSHQDLARFFQYSAEAPAVMVAKVLQLPNALMHYAKMQGRASKCILLLTSLSKDIERGQCFFPESELKKFGLTSLNENSAKQNPEEFAAFMKLQLNRYHVWQDEARKGDAFMPKKLRPIINRSRAWQEFVAKRIEKDPLSVFGNSFSYRLPNRIRARVGMLKK